MPNPTRIFVGPGAGYHFRTSAVDDWTLGLKVIYRPTGEPMDVACAHAADAMDIVRALNAWHAPDWQAAPMVVEADEQDEEEEEREGIEDVVQAGWSVA